MTLRQEYFLKVWKVDSNEDVAGQYSDVVPSEVKNLEITILSHVILPSCKIKSSRTHYLSCYGEPVWQLGKLGVATTDALLAILPFALTPSVPPTITPAQPHQK